MDKLKILVVDDESRMRKLVRDFLIKKNFEVLEAGGGAGGGASVPAFAGHAGGDDVFLCGGSVGARGAQSDASAAGAGICTADGHDGGPGYGGVSQASALHFLR